MKSKENNTIEGIKCSCRELRQVNGGGTGSESEATPKVIIDNGTGYVKAGFSGEEGPRAVFPAIVG